MNYVVAVLPDRIQAEAVYSALEQDGFLMDQVSLVGKGYKALDEFGFLDPKKESRQRAFWMARWLVPFGFVSGYFFNSLTAFDLFPWAGALGNHLIGGVFGAIAGAMGSFFVGGGPTLLFNNGEEFPYRTRLNAGNYLVVVRGKPNFTNRASRILKQFNPELVQGYVDPVSA